MNICLKEFVNTINHQIYILISKLVILNDNSYFLYLLVLYIRENA